MQNTLIAAALLALSATAALAECPRALSVTFVESAPKDRFEIVNTATGVVLTGVRIDLTTSAGGLIFDTEDGGAGVQVFQPFQSDSGLSATAVSDGAEVLDLGMQGLAAGDRAGFTIDVDDRLVESNLGQIRVTGGELQGATVIFSLQSGERLETVFDAGNRAKVCS